MKRYFTKKRIAIVGVFCLIAIPAVLAAGGLAGYEKGLEHYENNEIDKAIGVLKESLASSFNGPTSGKLQQADELIQNDKADEAEKILLTLLENEETAARARYELGRIYEVRGELDEAVTMFRNASNVISNNGSAYVGTKACKKCHLKQHKTWKTTKMAKIFEVLKPGVRAEAKVKLKFDPKKDYTTDAKCLECHTTGFGMPGGYKIPEAKDLKAVRRAKENAGITCEACHGPGSKYIPIHKLAMTKKRKYTLEELYEVGAYKVDAKTCTACHNRRKPIVEANYHFDYETEKANDTHKNFPLKYRIN